MNGTAYITKDYENVPALRLRKTNPNAGLWLEARRAKHGILNKHASQSAIMRNKANFREIRQT